jgi:cobalt-precorrin 5A hydrolase
MTTVVIVLRRDEAAERLATFLDATLINYSEDAFPQAFREHDRIVALMAIGIVVRNIAPLLKDKWVDPAVVVVSPDQRYAIPVIGGHHGANELASSLGPLGILPVITTASEALGLESVEVHAGKRGMDVLNRPSTREVNAAILESEVPLYTLAGPALAVVGPGVSLLLRKGEYFVGVGCNKGTSREEVAEVVRKALTDAGISPLEVMAYATTEKKRWEEGLIEGVRSLEGCLVFVDDETINAQAAVTPSRASVLGLNGVAEPAALAIARKKELVMEKRASGNVTVAIAR